VASLIIDERDASDEHATSTWAGRLDQSDAFAMPGSTREPVRELVVEEAPPAPNPAVVHQMPRPAPRLDVMKERYPLLRNAM